MKNFLFTIAFILILIVVGGLFLFLATREGQRKIAEPQLRVREVEALEKIAFYLEKWDDCGMPK